MANKKISELTSRTPSLTDLILVGDPSSGYSYKATVSALATIIETDISDGYVTLGTTQTISGAKTFSNVLTLTSVANANTDTDKFLVLNASNGVNYRTGAEVLSDIGGQGALSLAAIGSTPNANGATLSSNTLNLQPASGSFGGVVTTGFQEFAGQKRFLDNPIQFDKHLEVKNINTSGVSWGYTSFASKDTPAFGFLRGHSFTPTPTSYYAWFNYGTTGIREYTLPSSDGTLALTSDITGAVSGTTNYIPKFTSSSAIGNSVIYESSGNIGIGTTSPASVSGYTTLTLNNAVAGGNLVFQLNGSDKGSIYNSSSDLVIEVNSGATIFKNGSGEKMRLTSTGNLGIGTSSPAAKLNVVSTGNAFQIEGGGTGTMYQTFNTSGGNYYIGVSSSTGTGLLGGAAAYSMAIVTESARNISFGTNNTLRMTLDASGNLGLGVTPSAWSLAGLNVMQIKNGFIYGYSNETSYGVNAYYNGSSWTYIASAEATRYGQNSGVHAWYNAPSGTAGNAITFTQAMTLDASGRLGIGTTSPSYKLDVNGIVSGQYYRVVGSNGYSGQIIQQGDLLSTVSTNLLMQSASGTGIGFLTNGGTTFNMFINTSGNVGIGTTSPAQQLDVNGQGIFRNRLDIYNNGYGLIHGVNSNLDQYFLTQAVTNGFLLTTGKNGAFSVPYLAFGVNDGESMRITSGGNVGIGTTSPGSKLHVMGGSSPNNTIFATTSDYSLGSTGSLLRIGHVASTGNTTAIIQNLTIGGTGTGNISFPEGNVGIGTATAPGTNGIGLALYASDYPRLTFRNSTTGDGTGDGVQFVLANADFEMYNRESGALLFGTSNAERMRITSGGDVGIGVTSPGAKLEVNGAIKTAAPSGGTAKPFKIGAAAVVSPTSPNRTIEIEIDGVTYYLSAKTTND